MCGRVARSAVRDWPDPSSLAALLGHRLADIVGIDFYPRHALASAGPIPELVPRIKARLLAEPAGVGRPLGVGTLDQIVDDLVALAGLGAVEVIIDPNPDANTPYALHAASDEHITECVAEERNSPSR